jgi:saccharopine dehydrogenase (NAD+, L-lysine-forming)
MKYVVIGGAGAMGRITVTDLFHTCTQADEVVIADYDLQKAESLAKSFKPTAKSPKVSCVQVNIKEKAEAARKLEDAFILINCAQYQLNLEVMDIALKIPCHYTDLGGLFHYTRKQLEYNEHFKAVGKTALIGMGAAPGITNVLSAWAATGMDTVTEIHTRVGSLDNTKYADPPALPVAYSLKTILEEFSFEPAVFTKGEFKFVKAMSGDEPHRFPPPIGIRKPMYTIHSEVATLPISFKDKGVKEVSFKIAFDPVFVDRVRFLRDLGMASHDAVEVPSGNDADKNNILVRPIDVVNKVAMSQTPGRQVGKLKQYEVVRAIVKGTQKKKKITVIADLHTAGMPAWGIGIDIDTGSPPAVAAQMMAAGEIVMEGVVVPELAVPPMAFFKRLKIRKMTSKLAKKTGWTP